MSTTDISVTTTTEDTTEESEILAVEQIAKIVAGVAQVGHAQRLLELAGFAARIVANKITVDQEIIAQYICVNDKSWWQVYATDGTPPVWTVGATVEQNNWLGAVE